MKRTIAAIVSFLLLGIFLTGCTSEKKVKEAINSVQRYQYPIDYTCEDWFDYTVLEKSEMLRIPQETLDGMSDLQLLFATADYPYFVDAFIYGLDEDGFAVYAQYCSAFGELSSRKSFQKALKTYGKAVAQAYFSDKNDAQNISRADLILNILEVYTGTRPDMSEFTDVHISATE